MTGRTADIKSMLVSFVSVEGADLHEVLMAVLTMYNAKMFELAVIARR